MRRRALTSFGKKCFILSRVCWGLEQQLSPWQMCCTFDCRQSPLNSDCVSASSRARCLGLWDSAGAKAVRMCWRWVCASCGSGVCMRMSASATISRSLSRNLGYAPGLFRTLSVCTMPACRSLKEAQDFVATACALCAAHTVSNAVLAPAARSTACALMFAGPSSVSTTVRRRWNMGSACEVEAVVDRKTSAIVSPVVFSDNFSTGLKVPEIATESCPEPSAPRNQTTQFLCTTCTFPRWG